MKKSILVVLVVASCLTAPVSAATISIDPATTTVAMGSPTTLDINIVNVTDLYAFQFDLSFTPGILSATLVSDGGFPATSLFPGFIDNTAGMVTFIADSLVGPIAGVNGGGTLARIRFTATATGISQVTIANPVLLDSNLLDIPAAVTGASVTVQNPSDIPEPGTITLTLAGAVGIYFLRRRHNSSPKPKPCGIYSYFRIPQGR